MKANIQNQKNGGKEYIAVGYYKSLLKNLARFLDYAQCKNEKKN